MAERDRITRAQAKAALLDTCHGSTVAAQAWWSASGLDLYATVHPEALEVLLACAGTFYPPTPPSEPTAPAQGLEGGDSDG